MENKTRNILAGILVIFILGTAIFAYLNKDSLFKNEVEIVYPDGCIETYVNTVMVTEECTNGRDLAKEQQDLGLQDYRLDIE